ncbi:TetR/AcrR family transcriptional regulator [Cribrihabitans neustonicus]|uniref:TetR/AcrR family transcriptional regulator n=1 Tax=Cribrihabitans neustonicus TaxID=1429085 RepID=UPI003B59CA3D
MPRAAPYDRDTALEAAMLLFWRKGFHATSLKDLEAALRLKPGSIYAAFQSKENLCLLALERYFETARSQFRARVAASPSPLQGLADNLREFAKLPAEDCNHQPCMLVRTALDTRTTVPAIAARAQSCLDGMLREITAAFAVAQAEGELPADADPARLARRYQANLTALRLELHEGTDPRALRDLAEDMACETEALRHRSLPMSAPVPTAKKGADRSAPSEPGKLPGQNP